MNSELASLDRRRENIFIPAIVIAKLELIHVERKVLTRDLMERADDAALYHRPEAFDGVGMNRAENVLMACVIDGAVRVALSGVFVRAEQTHLVRNGLTHEAGEREPVCVVDDFGDDVALACDRA